VNEVVTNGQRQQAPLAQFKGDLARLKDAGELDMLPANVTYEAFRNAAVVAITDNPAILSCNKESIFKAIRRLAAAGLVPDGREAAIVPFSGQAQAMPMVYGLIKVARNSGEISSIWAEVVRGDEIFTISMVNGQRSFDHQYDPLRREGEVKGAYAVAKLKDGTIEVEAMGRDDIEKRRKSSANQRSAAPTGIWAQWYDEMAKKTVIRALVKRLPMSSEDVRRVMIEDEESSIRDVTPPARDAKPNLAQRLASNSVEKINMPAETVGQAEGDQEADGPSQTTNPQEAAPDAPYRALAANGAPTGDAWAKGATAFHEGKPITSCPYDPDEANADAEDWCGGWCGAETARS